MTVKNIKGAIFSLYIYEGSHMMSLLMHDTVVDPSEAFIHKLHVLESIDYPPYSPTMPPCDFHVSIPLKME
jgi:hypothetical protein